MAGQCGNRHAVSTPGEWSTDCVDTMLEIRVARKQQLSIMERLIELYLYDLSEFAREEAGAHITFEYDSLIRYGRDCVMAASD